VLVLLLACASPPSVGVPTGPTARLLTYNVDFERFDAGTIDAIEAADADVVFLQETTAEWEDAIRERLGDRYPEMAFHPHDPDGGQAILAKAPFTVDARVDSPVGAFPATWATVDTPAGTIRALHVHLHPPLDSYGLVTGYFTTGGMRADEVDTYLSGATAPADVVIGDFNEGSGAAIDRLEAAGLADAATALGDASPTWHADHWTGELKGRPDHVFLGTGWAPAAVEVRMDGGSDHRPLIVELGRQE
jgi:endonuclease/exonuclease/phosphatase (EEP) superfamily protein YafD